MVDNMATKEVSTATKVPMGKVKMVKISMEHPQCHMVVDMGIKARVKIMIALVDKTVKTAMGKVKMGNMDKEARVKAARINMVKVKTKVAKVKMGKEARGMVRIKAVKPKINMVKVKTKAAKVNMANLAKGMVKIKMAKAKIKVAMDKIKMVKQGMVKTRMAKVKANMDKEPRVMDKIKAKDNMANLDKRMAKIVNMALEIKVLDKINMANKAKEETDKINIIQVAKAKDNIPKVRVNMVANQGAEVATPVNSTLQECLEVMVMPPTMKCTRSIMVNVIIRTALFMTMVRPDH